MILGKLKDIEKYRGISKNFDIALESIIKRDFLKANMGKTLVNGENVFFNLAELISKNREDCLFETHKKYIDIQIVIEGEENFGFCLTTDKLEIKKEYDSKTDCSFFRGKSDEFLSLGAGDFIVFFGDEPHMPCVKVNKNSKIKKVIYKIAI